MSILFQQLKTFDRDVATIDELVALSATADLLSKAYADLDMEVPAWLAEKTTVIRRAVADKNRDQTMRELNAAKQSLEKLKTAEEKRRETLDRIAALEKKLSG